MSKPIVLHYQTYPEAEAEAEHYSVGWALVGDKDSMEVVTEWPGNGKSEYTTSILN